MIAVVTGSSGFIGSHLVDALLARGATVRALVRPETKSPRDDRIGYWTADLSDDRSVRECVIWKNVTHVFHLAGVTKRRTLAQFRYGNVVPTVNVLAAVVSRELPLKRFVYVSSQAAAGPALDAAHPVTEDDDPHPVEGYGRSKLEAEQATQMYSDRVPVTIVRPGAVYGPRDVDFLNVFREARRPVAFHAAPRKQALNLVYARDLAAGLLLAAEKDAAIGRTYFLADNTPVTWTQLYKAIGKVAGKKSWELQVPSPALRAAGQAGNLLSLLTGRHFLMNSNKIALSRPRWWLCDSSRAQRELGWSATTELQQGLLETYQWYLAEGWLRAPKRTTASAATEKENVL